MGFFDGPEVNVPDQRRTTVAAAFSDVHAHVQAATRRDRDPHDSMWITGHISATRTALVERWLSVQEAYAARDDEYRQDDR